MSDIKPGDLVVVFRATIARKHMTNDYVWIDRNMSPSLVLWTGVVCDPDTGQPHISVLLNTEETKGIFEFPQDALVHA